MSFVPLSFVERVWLAFACWFRVLFDGSFAARVHLLAESASMPPPAAPELPAAPSNALVASDETQARVGSVVPTTQRSAPPPAGPPVHQPHEAALGLLALFQREGRLVDFLQQDVESFPDADIGAAARVVHAGCRRALSSHFDIVRVRPEQEGSAVAVLEGEVSSVRLTGNVRGMSPYRGVLRHAGWRATRVNLPELVPGHDSTLVCAAEVEL